MSGTVPHRRVPRLLADALLLVLLAGLVPAAAQATGPDRPPAAPAGTRLDPPTPDLTGATTDATTDATTAAATGSSSQDGTAEPPQEPTTAYLEAMAHESDRIDFVPGGRVTLGFTPRATDNWPVDGHAPLALPAGRATGRQMAASPNGSRWADVGAPADEPIRAADPAATAGPAATPAPSDAPVDAAGGMSVTSATGTSYADPRQPAVDLAAASGLRRQVFGFLPYWEVSGASTKLNYDVLSTIAYFSVGATGKGDLRKKDPDGTSTTGWGGWTSSSMTQTIRAAHEHGTRVVLTISVFAWTSSQAAVQKALLGSSTARLNLARQAAAAVRDRGADGVNLDFEPVASGYADEFVALLKTFRTELNRIRAGYQITYDTTGSIGNYPLEASVGSGAADAIFIMGYDYRTSGASSAGSIDPLSGPKYDLADTVRAYTARVSPSRVVLGLPWYGRAWSTTSSAARAPTHTGAKYGYSTAVNYENVTGLVAQYGRHWDAVEQSPYVVYRRQNCTSTYGCVTSWRQVYYDDAASLKLRLSMVNDYGLRGAGMWALGYDGGHPELYRAVSESFLVDKSAPQAGITMLASTERDEGFLVTWGARDTSRVVSYDVQVSTNGGGWVTWLAGTTSTRGVWLGTDGAGYAFRVRARDNRGNTGAYNVGSTWESAPALRVGGFGRVLADGLAYRTGPGTSAARLGTLDAGTIVALTRGPVSADGLTWYEVTQPVREWNPVTFVERGVWIAVSSSSTAYVAAYRAPNSTRVAAGLTGMDFGTGATAVGTSSTATNVRRFSPNGDGSEDALRVRWTNAIAMDTLELRAFRTDGTSLGGTPLSATGAGAHAVDWDGRIGGTRLPDGRYVLQLVGIAAGKTYAAPSIRPAMGSQVALYVVTIDTVAPVIKSAAATYQLISPNADGYRDATKATLVASGATRWTARVTSPAGGTVRTTAGSGGTATFTWPGTDASGTRVADGRYTVTLTAWDEAGNASARAWGVTVDTAGPVIAPAARGSIFSPNGDGSGDRTTLSFRANERGTGLARILHGTTVVRSWTISGLASWSATWNGRTAAGTAVPDGTYTFRVSLKDAAGNRRTASTTVVVDRTASTLRWSGDMYPQDRDGLRPSAALTWRLTRTATTTLRVYDAGGALVRTVWSGRRQAAGTRSWRWDGRLADGTTVPQGRYTARLTVTSSLGTQALARSVWVAAFAVTPSARTVYAGQTLTVRFRSVEPLATRPTVTFTQPGRAGVKVTATRLADGTYRASFTVATGTAGAGTIRVAGTDSAGHANATVVPVTIGSR